MEKDIVSALKDKKSGYVSFVFSQRWKSLLMAAMIVITALILSFLIGYFPFSYQSDVKDNWLFWGAILQIGVLVSTISLFLIEAHENWKSSFSKFLSVDFVLQKDSRLIMKAEHYPLTGESDIRGFAQQIGSQFAASKNPDADNVRIDLPMTLTNEYDVKIDKKNRAKMYYAKIYLSDYPKFRTKMNRKDYLYKKLDEGNYLHARYAQIAFDKRE